MESFIIGFDKSRGCITKANTSYTQDMIFQEIFESTTILCIDSEAFKQCTSPLIDLSNTKITKINANAFESANIGRIILPETLTEMENNVFLYAYLETIHIPAATIITVYTFNFANIFCFTVDEKHPTYSSEKGFLMNKNKSAIIAVPRNITNEKDFPYFTSIGTWAMSGAPLKTFTGNSDFSLLNYGSFHGLGNVELLDLSRTSIKTLPSGFAIQSKIKHIVLPANLEVMKKEAFDTIRFKIILIPATVSTIEDSTFNCNATFTVVYLGSKDYSSIDIFSTLDLTRIKVFVTVFYKEERFGHIKVNRKWINEQRTCKFHRRMRDTFSPSILLYLVNIHYSY